MTTPAEGPAPTPPLPLSGNTNPLWGALESGVGELERALARGGQGVGAVGVVLSAYVTVFVSQRTGFTLMIFTAGTVAFYTAVHHLMSRGGPIHAALRYGVPAFEASMPAVILWILVQTEGPAYALGSWVPPQLFTLFIAASILRLDPYVPAGMGAVAALGYGTVYFGSIHGDVDQQFMLHRTEMQVVRITSLMLTGITCSGAVLGLRRAIAAAGRTVREQNLFGKYRLMRNIASGGMGRVVEAVYCPEGGFERRVAVKLVHPHLARDEHFVNRFRSEAGITARLHHPNIVGALDFGRVGDTYFLAMEYVDGRTLHSILSERRSSFRPLEPRHAAFIGLQIAEALDYAHAQAHDALGNLLRVVHRDLSPSNVMIDRTGRVRITDFGVARALAEADEWHSRDLVGKPSYVPPEAVRAEAVDERADLWSLAVVLWEALANRRLFKRDHDGAAMLAVVEAEIPPLAEVRPGLLPHWEPFFARALARERDLRFRSASELHDALSIILVQEGPVMVEEIAELVQSEDELEELELDGTSEAVALPDPVEE